MKIRTKQHNIMEAVAWLAVLVCFGIAIYGIATLPDEIATHFTFRGEPDGYGSPTRLLILPVIMLSVDGVLSIVAHVVSPRHWNTPTAVTRDNSGAVYRALLTMTHLLQLEVSLWALFMESMSYLQNGFVLVPTLVFFVIFTVTIFGMVARMYRQNMKG